MGDSHESTLVVSNKIETDYIIDGSGRSHVFFVLNRRLGTLYFVVH